MGFEKVTLNDIFPSDEQQKVANLNNKIQEQVRKSVEQGATGDALRNLGFNVKNVDDNVIRLASHLPRLRYAIYDVANTATIAGTALLGISLATFKVAADFERNFADVVRTTGLAGEEAKKLESALIDISKSIPVGFADLTQIATLAGQLNIAEQNIGNFTETVAKFSATTDVTIDAAATAFGRLDQLVDGVNGQFDKLGSSILAVGVNAVATESDIIAIATQIASIANVAGFTASELIGFSSALASVGTRPELARGTFTRLFTEIQQSVGEGGDQLEAFARTANRSVDEFRSAWTSGDGTEIVVSILEGLAREGQNADRALAGLGITSVRDVPTILKLAQGVEDVRRQIAIANLGFIAGTELQTQYSIITNTVSEKVVVLKNNFQALVAAVGGLTGPLSFIIDVLIKAVDLFESIARSPVVGTATGIVTALLGILGVIGLVVGGFARAIGSFSGAATSLIEMRVTIATAKLAMADMTATQEINTNSTNRGTVANELYAKSLRDVAVASGISAGASAADAGAKGAGSLKGLGGDIFKLSGATKGIKTLAKFATRLVLPLFAVVTIVELLDQQFEFFGKRVEKVTKDIGPFLTAAEADTKAYAEATDDLKDSYTTFEVSINDAKSELGDYVKLVTVGEGKQDQLKELIDETTGAITTQTMAIGENTKALIRQQLAQDILAATEVTGLGGAITNIGTSGPELRQNEALRDLVGIIVDSDLNERIVELGFNYEEFGNAVAEGSVDAANAIADNLAPAAAELADQLESENAEKYATEIKELRKIAIFATDGLKRFSGSGLEVQEAMKEAKVAAILAGEGFIEQEAAVASADEALKAYKLSLGNAFGTNIDATNQLYDSLKNIDSALESNGTSFDDLSINGAANLQVLQDSTYSAILAAEALGMSSADTIALVYARLVASGVMAADALIVVTRLAEGLGVEVPGADALADATERLGAIFANVGRSAGGAAKEVKTFAEAASELTSALFESINAGRAVEDSIFSLGEAFGETGKEALYASDEMQSAISAVLNSSDDGQSAVANLSALFVKLSNTVGSQSDPSLQILRQTINSVAQEFGVTNAEVERFIKLGGSDLANINVDNFARGASNAVKEVRTLLDYAGDLSSIFSRSFDIRFKASLNMDSITESWSNLNDEVEETTLNLSELSADRSVKEYFLSVAEAYGDTLRADTLRAELDKVDKEISDAQALLSRDVVGDSPGARQNRSVLTGIIGDYQDYITSLAESGASQDELRQATAEARREFEQQARELGFAEADIQMYAAAFDDVRTAIDNVPRNITVDANVNPALQALNELNASLNKQIQAANDLNRALNQPVASSSSNGQLEVVDRYEVIVKAKQAAGIGLSNSVASLTRTQRAALGLPYYNGGFTGRGGKMDPAGIVHKGEYVVPQKYVNQSTGLPDANFLAQLQNGMRGYAQGGFVGGGMGDGTMMVELSPFDRKLLSDAGNVQLRLNGKVVAEATNTNNFNEARRGSN